MDVFEVRRVLETPGQMLVLASEASCRELFWRWGPVDGEFAVRVEVVSLELQVGRAAPLLPALRVHLPRFAI